MKSSRMLWGSVSIIALLSTALFIFGFIYAVQDILSPPSLTGTEEIGKLQPGELAQQEGTIRVVSLGDSLTKGTGDESGKGYVGYVIDHLGKVSGNKVKLINNLAINGFHADELLYDVLNIKSQAYVISQADLILLTIGGNDLSQAVQKQNGGSVDITAIDHIDPNSLEKLLTQPKENTKKILKRIAEINPKARIVYVGLYNPFYDLDTSLKSNLVIEQWNSDLFDIVNDYPNMMLVPTQDLFQKQSNKYLAQDHFHPNQAGYERIAQRIIQALE